MNKEEFIGKLQMVYVGDRNAFNEIVEDNQKLKNEVVYSKVEIDRLNNKVLELENINEKIGLALDSAENKVDRLNKEYERIYNENCKLRENHNINDITLLDENERLNRIIDNIFKFMQNKYDNSDLTGFTISFMELQDLKELKENNK